MRTWLAECFARLILASKVIDKSYYAIDRARSALILGFASEAVANCFNDLSYGRDLSYHPESPTFRRSLFAWEERAIATYFPPPPARVLIGGAGGGREVIVLAEKGYEVTAFDPCASLAAAMSCCFAGRLNIKIYRARYEDMPHLFPARPDASSMTLEEGSSFDAAVLGWGSYSHLRTEAQRIRALSSFGRYVYGPILLSFSKSLDTPSPMGRSRSAVKKWLKPDSNDFFSVYAGFTHAVRGAELEATARQAGLKIVDLNEGRTADALSPHAVLVPVDFPNRPNLQGISRYTKKPSAVEPRLG